MYLITEDGARAITQEILREYGQSYDHIETRKVTMLNGIESILVVVLGCVTNDKTIVALHPPAMVDGD